MKVKTIIRRNVTKTENVLCARYTESGRGKEEMRSRVTDMLADLRHLCDAKGLDFAEIDRVARTHYVTESSDARKGETL